MRLDDPATWPDDAMRPQGRRPGDDPEPAGTAAPDGPAALPSWLLADERYVASRDRDGFIRKSALSLMSVLARLRMDAGQATRLSPSAPVKLACGLVLILLTSLSRNFAFVLAMLAVVLAREAFLPPQALRRCMGVSAAAALMTAAIMAPALLLGQTRSLVVVSAKVFVTVGIAMTVALSTPASGITGALRSLHVPDEAIMCAELALKGAADLGRTALETLQALGLRSVGHDARKGSALGGVLGTTFLRAHEAARTTSDAMRCRGFEGEYASCPPEGRRPADAAWAVLVACSIAAFLYLESVA